MNEEFLKWLALIPKGYKVTGHKETDYNGQAQVKLFIKKPC